MDPQAARAAVAALPRLALGAFPTPVRRLPLAAGLWLKDEGGCAAAYGGNKVRKWEFLAPALAGRRLVLWGDPESHNLLAGARLGRLAGCAVELVVHPYRPSSDEGRCLAALREAGATIHQAGSLVGAWAWAHWLVWRQRAVGVPLGSTTPLSCVGWVAAAHELEDQVTAGALPPPALAYLALGSGGTVAGLLVGLATTALPTRVVAVRTVPTSVCSLSSLRRLVRATVRRLGLPRTTTALAMMRLERIDDRQLGEGYRDQTPAALAAVAAATAHDLELEPVFTGKALACLLDDVRRDPGLTRLYWHTHARRAG